MPYLIACVPLDALWDHPGSFNMTGPHNTAGIFATYPGKHLTIVNGFFDQVLFWDVELVVIHNIVQYIYDTIQVFNS